MTKIVLGLDRVPALTPKFYAVVIRRDGKILFSGEVRKEDIPGLIQKFRVDAIAIDNLWELWKDSSEVKAWMRKYKIRVFKSTGPPGKELKLWQLAKMYGVRLKEGHMSPEQAALVSAKLVFLDAATEVILFEDATEIIIGRAKSTGPGGQHANRYARLLASAVQSAFSEIIDKLKYAGFDFVAQTKPGDYGLKSAHIVVYASYDKVSKVVQNYKGELYQIIVRPVERDRLLFVTKKEITKKPYVIIGLDPGETVGLAILDLSGKILYVGSQSDLGLIKTLEIIYEHGIPIVFSCDVPHVQGLIKKIASKVGAIVYIPKRVLSVDEKRNIVRGLGIKVKDSHERDALVAAFLAWQHYRKILEKVDYILSCLPPLFDHDEIKKEVIFGKPLKEVISSFIRKYIDKQISSALQSIELKFSRVTFHDWEEERKKLLEHLEKEREKFRVELKALQDEIRKLRVKLKEKDAEIAYLNKQLMIKNRELNEIMSGKISQLESQYIVNLKSQLQEALSQIRKLKEDIIQLKNENQILRKLLTLRENEMVIGYVINLDELETLYQKYPTRMVALIVNSAKTPKKIALNLIKEMQIKYLFVKENWQKLKWIENEVKITVLPMPKRLDVIKEEIIILDQNTFDEILEDAFAMAGKNEEFIEMTLRKIVTEYRKKKMEEQIED